MRIADATLRQGIATIGCGHGGGPLTTDTHPLTRAELREELAIWRTELRDELRTYYATKADLADLRATLILTMVAVVSVATGVIIAVDRLAG